MAQDFERVAASAVGTGETTLLTSNSDDALIGIIADGFFIYGRKCNSTNDYPTDLDASGGHTSITQHSQGASEYHYHIQNELYLNQYLSPLFLANL